MITLCIIILSLIELGNFNFIQMLLISEFWPKPSLVQLKFHRDMFVQALETYSDRHRHATCLRRHVRCAIPLHHCSNSLTFPEIFLLTSLPIASQMCLVGSGQELAFKTQTIPLNEPNKPADTVCLIDPFAKILWAAPAETGSKASVSYATCGGNTCRKVEVKPRHFESRILTHLAYNIANGKKSYSILQQFTERISVTLITAFYDAILPIVLVCLTLDDVTSFLRIANVRNTCRCLGHSQTFGGVSSVQWRKAVRIWRQLLFHRSMCVRIEI